MTVRPDRLGWSLTILGSVLFVLIAGMGATHAHGREDILWLDVGLAMIAALVPVFVGVARLFGQRVAGWGLMTCTAIAVAGLSLVFCSWWTTSGVRTIATTSDLIFYLVLVYGPPVLMLACAVLLLRRDRR